MHQSEASIWPQVGFSQSESSVRFEPHCGVRAMAEAKFFPAFAIFDTKFFTYFFKSHKKMPSMVIGNWIEHLPFDRHPLVHKLRAHHVVLNARRIFRPAIFFRATL